MGFSSVILEGPSRWSVRPVVEAYYDRDLGVSQTSSALCGAILDFLRPVDRWLYETAEAFGLDPADYNAPPRRGGA